jgi:elongator complex protein 3
MDIFAELTRRGQKCSCIRCREVRGEKIIPASLTLVDLTYSAECAEEHFIQFVTPPDENGVERIAAYLRLSLPLDGAPDLTASLPDLSGAALVREVHVYGQSLAVGAEQDGAAQHAGLGTRLLEEAARAAHEQGFRRLAVIAAVGTRLYYERRGFSRGKRYLVRELTEQDS